MLNDSQKPTVSTADKPHELENAIEEASLILIRAQEILARIKEEPIPDRSLDKEEKTISLCWVLESGPARLRAYYDCINNTLEQIEEILF